jgi:hypothetical protein
MRKRDQDSPAKRIRSVTFEDIRVGGISAIEKKLLHVPKGEVFLTEWGSFVA